MDKTVHASVTECASSSPSEKSSSNDMIKEVAVDKTQPAAAPSRAIKRTNTVYRRRKQKPLPLDRFRHAFHRIPRAAKVLIVIILTGIPFMSFMLIARFDHHLQHKTIGPAILDATYFKLSKWMTICWASLLIIFGLAESLARFASWACSQSTASQKYAPLANTLCFRVTMLTWAGAAHQANCRIWNDPYKVHDNWPAKLKQVFEFLIISFSILLVQGIGLQLIALRYVEGYVGPRSKRASNELETIRELNYLVKRHIEHDDPSFALKIFKKIFFPVEDSAFDAIVAGQADEAEHKEYAAKIWNTVTMDMHKEVLTLADISSRLKDMGRDPTDAEDLFIQLDQSCDGEVTRDEFEALVVNTGAQLNKRADSMRGIKRLLRKLEVLLTVVVFGVIVFIFSNFVDQNWIKDSKALWTGVTGLGFALNGTIQDFVASCVYVFAKHGYDVGDLVEAKSKKLLVRDIHLTHTNFEEIREGDDADATGMLVQISHTALATEVIVNWTRSNDLKIARKEKEEDGCCALEERKPSVTQFGGW